ncbi:Ada metal-binding domain-containing protein [Bacillus sp. D48C]
MKDQNNLSRDTMWKATVSCDSAYDGIFFYAVKTTGIFCRPSCKSKVPNYENVSFFSNAQEAQRAGYQSVSSFYNAFKRNTGFSPSQFRAFHSGNTVNQELD